MYCIEVCGGLYQVCWEDSCDSEPGILKIIQWFDATTLQPLNPAVVTNNDDPNFQTVVDAVVLCIAAGAPTISSRKDQELICYVTAANLTIQQAWAVHDDSLIGSTESHVDGTIGIAYYTATIPATPLDITQAGFELVPCPALFSDIPPNVLEVCCLCDDINGDGTLYENFNRVTFVDEDGLTTVIDYTADFSATYVPVNPIDCGDIGLPADIRTIELCDDNGTFWRDVDIVNGLIVKTYDASGNTYVPSGMVSGTCQSREDTTPTPWKQGRVLLSGGAWYPDASITSYTVRAEVVDDPDDPPTFTDSFGVVTPIYSHETFGYSETGQIATGSVVRANQRDIIIITYTGK